MLDSGKTDGREPEFGTTLSGVSPREYFLHPVIVLPGVSIVIYLLAVASLFLFSEDSFPYGTCQPLWEVLCGYRLHFPWLALTFFFGVVGGMGRFIIQESMQTRLNRVFVSGILGSVSYLAIKSGVLISLVYKPSASGLEVSASFEGVCLMAFLFGLFSSETIKYGVDRVNAARKSSVNESAVSEKTNGK